MDPLVEERVERQLYIDSKIKFVGDEKHDKNSLRLAQESGFGETDAGKRFLGQSIKGFVEKFNEYVDKQLERTTTRSILIRSLVEKEKVYDEETNSCITQSNYKLDPYTLGKIVVRSLLRSLVRPEDKRITVTGVAFDIGEAVEFTIKEIELDTHHKKKKMQLMDMLKRQGKLGDKGELEKMLLDLSERVDMEHVGWDKKTQGAVGQSLLELLYISKVYYKDFEGMLFGDIFVEHEENSFKTGKKMTKKTLDISKLGMQWIKDNDDYVRSITLSYLPMVIPPKDWTIDHGGYYDQALYDTYSLIKGFSRQKIRKLYENEKFQPGFETIIKTINNLQNTPFKINNTVWEAVNWVHTQKFNLDRKGIPTYQSGWVKIIGQDKAEEFFKIKRLMVKSDEGRLTEDSRDLLLGFIKEVIEGSSNMEEKDLWKEWSNIRRTVIKHSRGEKSKTILVDNTLRESEEFLDEEIYFCYNVDYRGRIYPLASQFSPQGSDISRGMLEFARGVKVTSPDAIRQISIVIANNWGEDKVSLDDREMWTYFNTDMILKCADNYEDNREWMEADKPFLFLLSCLEWKKVIDAKERGDELDFYTTLPIAFDGSCNGIQHYSAMFLDPKGAKAVNLTLGEVPSDVYQEVADKALELAKSSKGKVEKLIVRLSEDLSGKLFGRKVAKRSVMTLPYGVSKKSSNAYVVEMVDDLIRNMTLTTSERKSVRSKMGSLIWEAILLVVEKPVTGKEYFQSVANEVAMWNKGLLWTTPTGFPVLQSLKKRDVKPNSIRVTIEGKVVMRRYPRYLNEIDGKEQANAVAPNFVHSFDSAHLQLTINAAAKDGMKNFLVIHDSFSTDANNAGRFNKIIRREFVNMYKDFDHVNKFHDECEEMLDITLETPRETLGDFKIEEVLKSEYFFS